MNNQTALNEIFNTLSNTTQMAELASVFANYSTKLDLIICDNSTSKWMRLMEEKAKATVH